MKVFLLILILLTVAGCAIPFTMRRHESSLQSHECSVDQMMQAISELRMGMSKEAACSLLQRYGITGGGGFEQGFYKAEIFSLSTNYDLVLVFRWGMDKNADPRNAGLLSNISVQDRRDGTTAFNVTNMLGRAK